MSDQAALGFRAYQETQKMLARALLLALLLLLSHVLVIKSSEVDAGGIKIAIKDMAVLHGALAVLFLYYFWMITINGFEAAILMRMPGRKRLTLRRLISSGKVPYRHPKLNRHTQRSPSDLKKRVYRQMAIYNIWTFPYGMMVALLLVGSLLVGLYDLWEFFAYLIHRLITLWS